ncbi:hypothetical protein CLV98_1231, partial [Dyadobacter jejuensis]
RHLQELKMLTILFQVNELWPDTWNKIANNSKMDSGQLGGDPLIN